MKIYSTLLCTLILLLTLSSQAEQLTVIRTHAFGME